MDRTMDDATGVRTRGSRRRARRLMAVTMLALVLGTSCASRASSDPESTRGSLTRAGVQLTIPQVIHYAYDAGFHDEDTLVTVVSIAIAESSLWTQWRHWHVEYGYRPATDAIGVEGPANVWNANHTQQVHSDRGLWQISTHWWGQYSDARSDNPAEAAKIVMEMSKLGTDFRPWDSWYKNKNALKHYDTAYNGWPAVRPIVRQFLSQR
jgi:Lysozyme like domain